MILDNADDLDTFCPTLNLDTAADEGTLPLQRYLPQSLKGLLLITTRDERVGKRLAGRQASIVINPMSYSEAQKLLESQMDCRTSLNIDESKTLLDALGYIPLAITQTAAFISENSITLKEYLELFTLNDSEIQSLLSEDLGDLRRDSESQSSVIRKARILFFERGKCLLI